MPAPQYEITFKKPVTFPPSGSIEDATTYGDDYQMILVMKTPIGDPVPSAPVFDPSMTASAPVNITGERDAATIRTTQFTYDYPSIWEPNSDRVADATLPYTPPDNIYTFEYRDKMDVTQSYTSIIWFTEVER